MGRVMVGSAVHFVWRAPGGDMPRCCAARVLDVSDVTTDVYRDANLVGLEVRPPLSSFELPLSLGGSLRDDGREPTEGEVSWWSCTGLFYDVGTWHPMPGCDCDQR